MDEETEEYPDALGAGLMRDKSLTVRLIGHTDNFGSAQFNQRLSLRRADAVRDHLLTLGIAPERILTEGKCETVRLNGNANDEKRALSRRVKVLLKANKRGQECIFRNSGCFPDVGG